MPAFPIQKVKLRGIVCLAVKEIVGRRSKNNRTAVSGDVGQIVVMHAILRGRVRKRDFNEDPIVKVEFGNRPKQETGGNGRQ